jgi:hypothetical protein
VCVWLGVTMSFHPLGLHPDLGVMFWVEFPALLTEHEAYGNNNSFSSLASALAPLGWEECPLLLQCPLRWPQICSLTHGIP